MQLVTAGIVALEFLSFLYFVSIEVGGVAIFEINYYCKRSVVRLIPVQSQTANKGTQTYAPQSRCTA